MRPSPLSSIAQSLALVLVGLLLLAFVIIRSYSEFACGGFFLCNGSLLPPVGNLFAMLEWLQHVAIMLLVLFAVIAIILALMVYTRQDWDMLSALRIAALFVAAQGLAAVGSMLTFGLETFHTLSAALTLGAVSFLMARVTFTNNDEYRQGTFLAVLGLMSLFSVVPYVLNFTQ